MTKGALTPFPLLSRRTHRHGTEHGSLASSRQEGLTHRTKMAGRDASSAARRFGAAPVRRRLRRSHGPSRDRDPECPLELHPDGTTSRDRAHQWPPAPAAPSSLWARSLSRRQEKTCVRSLLGWTPGAPKSRRTTARGSLGQVSL